MSLFKWKFSVKDTVQDQDGVTYKVQSFDPEGKVVVLEEGKDSATTRFGGSLRLVKKDRTGG